MTTLPEELSPETAAGVIGTGVQARLQIEAAHLVRPFKRVLVWGRDPAHAKKCAADLSEKLGIEVRVETDPARLVAESQLVVTTTPARAPVLQADWPHRGLHITAMASDISFADLTGTGAQDTAIATHVVARAVMAGSRIAS